MNTPHEETEKKHSTGLWWIGLFFFGVCSLLLNIAHARESDSLEDWVAVLEGVIPVLACAVMSHGITDSRPSKSIWVVRGGILGVFVMGMWMSVGAQKAMVEPSLGNTAILLPFVIDLSTFICLYFIMTASMATENAARRAAVEADIRPDIEADIRRTYEADIARAVADKEADIRADKEADMGRTLAAREADIQTTYNERLAAREAELEGGYNERLATSEEIIRQELTVEIEGRYRREGATKTRPNSGSPAKKGKASTPSSDAPASKDTLKALLKREPGLTVKDQAASLGVADRTIRRWRNELAEEGFALADIVQLRAAN